MCFACEVDCPDCRYEWIGNNRLADINTLRYEVTKICVTCIDVTGVRDDDTEWLQDLIFRGASIPRGEWYISKPLQFRSNTEFRDVNLVALVPLPCLISYPFGTTNIIIKNCRFSHYDDR